MLKFVKNHDMKYLFLFIFLIFGKVYIYSQILNLPERQESALNGSQFVELVTDYSLTDREEEIYFQVMSGNVPEFQRNLIPVSFTENISSVDYNVVYYVLPDYLAIGCDTNYFLCPMSPLMAQLICNSTGCTMPTRKMVDQIWNEATVKLAPSPISPSPEMITIPVMNDHNTTVWGQRSAVIELHPLGELVGGDKKDVVISNIIYGNPAPGRVVIYGWHQLSGSPIQPLYAGHEETYADYSHGIRLVQNAITINGEPNTITSVLQSSTLFSLFSDEDIINVPWYPVAEVPVVQTPQSFAVTCESPASLNIHILTDPFAVAYYAQLSSDGITFSDTITLSPSNTLITGLEEDSLYFLRIAAVGSSSVSDWSEVLGAATSENTSRILVVNGFDRPMTGNTYNFIRQHGNSIVEKGYSFDAATNEAVIDELISMQSYPAVDYILGNESTADETFSITEQEIVKTYLQNGGRLLVSGGEIAWDLDHMGSVDDKSFYNQYFKSSYIADAPNDESNTFYAFEAVPESIFDGLPVMTYDDGTHGTYNVSYPDVLEAINGGISAILYSDLTSNYACVVYEGLFPDGISEGKLVNLGFPFETVYPQTSRDSLMARIIDFFFYVDTVAMPVVVSPVVYCQNDIAVELTAYGESLLWYTEPEGGTGSSTAIIPATDVPGLCYYYVSQTINETESNRAEIVVEVKPLPETPVLTHVGTDLLSDYSGTNQWYHNGLAVSGASFQLFQPDTTGYYCVKAYQDGCYSTVSDTFFVEIPDFIAHSVNICSDSYPEQETDSCYQSFNFTFENETVDFNNNPNNFLQKDYSINSNLFEIGNSYKNTYINEYFGSNALMTDTINPYLKSNLSSVRFKIRCIECLFDEFSLDFYYKMDCDTLHDGGLVQYSTDDGLNWDNIINCTFCDLTNFYGAEDTISSLGDVGFNSSVETWAMSGIHINTQELSEIDFRFVFGSDSCDSGKNGWLIDNISINGSTVHIPENTNTNKVSLFPNPVTEISVLQLNDNSDDIERLVIYDITGRIVFVRDGELFRECVIDQNSFISGLYFYKIKTNNSHYYFGKFVVE